MMMMMSYTWNCPHLLLGAGACVLHGAPAAERRAAIVDLLPAGRSAANP